MRENFGKGLFVCFDGPNGSGKSTIIQMLKDKLLQNNIDTISTKEPTDSELGLFIRKQSEYIAGDALACLVAGNRYEHIQREIIPALNDGKVVLSDRYILSSFILQGIDGVNYDFIDKLNSNVIRPDIQVVLTASNETIQERLKERDELTRFEKNNKTSLELRYLNEGIEYMKSKYEIQIYRFNTDEYIGVNVDKIFNIITSVIKSGEKGKYESNNF